jgi:hypothetical protein
MEGPRTKRRVWNAAVVAAVLASTAGSGCVTTDNSTQLTVVLSSEAAIPTQVNQLVVTVSSDNSTKGPYTYDLTRDTNGYFPQTVALIPQDESQVSQSVTVSVEAQYVDPKTGLPTDVVLRSAVASYVEGHTLLLPMPLRMACFETTCDGAGQSCVGGVCTKANVSDLVDYKSEYVFAQPGACFDSVQCLAAPVQVPAPQGNDCTFPLPAGAATPGGAPAVNVSVEWDAAPGLVIVLDGDDAHEGWTPVAGDPTRGQLSPGVCSAVKRQAKKSQAKGFYVSTGCAAKSHLQPACDPTKNIGVPLP